MRYSPAVVLIVVIAFFGFAYAAITGYLPAVVLTLVLAFFGLAAALQAHYDRKHPYSDWNL
jgi:uncharacterized oligopeptide transporter (OPT) family protein